MRIGQAVEPICSMFALWAAMSITILHPTVVQIYTRTLLNHAGYSNSKAGMF